MFELRLHGRGGQGIVTAAELLVKAASIEGKWGQSIPMFGAERRGAPVIAYARVSNRPIRIHSQIYEPDAVAVFDSRIIEIVNVTSGLKNGGVIILNTSRGVEGLKLNGYKVVTVDATRIAVNLKLVTAGFPIVNTAMIGAIVKATGLVKLESVITAIRNTWSGGFANGNIKAVEKAYEETVGVDYGDP
ncbi:MAG: 2-oxoacid:acceptor oxidoreductase family protein [Candidatus Methanomethylicia archaeon]